MKSQPSREESKVTVGTENGGAVLAEGGNRKWSHGVDGYTCGYAAASRLEPAFKFKAVPVSGISETTATHQTDPLQTALQTSIYAAEI